MREIDRIIQEQFDGDVEKALYHLMYDEWEIDGLTFDDIYQELERSEKIIVANLLETHTIHPQLGGQKGFWQALWVEHVMLTREWDEDAIRTSKVNPYTKPLLKYLTLFLICSALLLGILFLYFSLSLGNLCYLSIVFPFWSVGLYGLTKTAFSWNTYRKAKQILTHFPEKQNKP